MGVFAGYFYGFDKPKSIPSPFDTVSQVGNGITSNLSNGASSSRLSGPMLKALLRWCKIRTEDFAGAVGIKDGCVVTEYVSSIAGQTHLVFYNPTTGDCLTGVYDTKAKTMADYKIEQKKGSGKDGTAIFLALIPELMKNSEFEEHIKALQSQYDLGIPDMYSFIYSGRILCDNIYRQIEKGIIALSTNCLSAKKFSLNSISNGDYLPDTILRGQFSVFNNGITANIPSSTSTTKKVEFAGKFSSGRVLTAEEEKLVPTMPNWYICPEEVLVICKHVQKTTNTPQPMRNFMLRGPAGTGKTKAAQAVASGLHLPYVKFTCSANTEIYDFHGQMLPVESKKGCDVSLSDIWFDPEGAWESLTGEKKADVTSDEVFEMYKQLCGNGENTQFRYTETDFLLALKNGWVIEIQEPTVILQQGVLVGLNSLLENDGSIRLMTGEIIHRHPDAVVIISTNVDYEGCREMNQSVTDRMNLVIDMDLPPLSVIKARAMSVTGFSDNAMADKMIRVLDEMNNYAKENNMEVVIGIRSLIDWMASTLITEDAYASALTTIVSKSSSDKEFRQGLITTCLDPIISKKR